LVLSKKDCSCEGSELPAVKTTFELCSNLFLQDRRKYEGNLVRECDGVGSAA